MVRAWVWAALASGGLCTATAQTGTVATTSGASDGSTAPTELRIRTVVNGGSPGDLSGNDVQLLDNGQPVAVTSFGSAAKMPTHVILVIDDVNARLTTVAYERSELKKFFLRNEGQLRAPFTVAYMTDTRLDIQPGFSQNGVAENDALQNYKIGLHEITRDSQYGGLDRTNIGIRALSELVAYAAGIPGHKLILFVSPGWPLLSGPRADLTKKEVESIFATVMRLQDAMLREDVTVDMLNPFGPGENLLRSDYYQAFLKGVKRPADAELADLSLQVLATHSGGTIYQGSSDIDGMMEKSTAELDHGYSIGFAPAPGEGASGYHELKLQVKRPGVTARIPDEYYTPWPPPIHAAPEGR